jgi:ABC-type nitrate/sulfonate/bicarbonate transport system permease component
MAQARVIATPEIGRRASFGSPVLWVRAATVVGALVVWEALARSGLFYRDVIPSTLAVAAALADTILSPAFYHHLGVTFAEVLVGFAGGAAIGVGSGIALGVHPFLRRCCEPYLNAIGATPKIVFLPIIFLMFGVGIESKMAKGALSAFFPTVFATTLGVMLISPVLIRVGQSFSLTTWQMITKIYLPAMVGPVVVGLRLGLGVAIIGILVAEIKFSDGGLGYLLINDYDQFKIAPMYAVMLILFALAAFANWGMTKLQAKFSYGKSVSAAGDLGATR